MSLTADKLDFTTLPNVCTSNCIIFVFDKRENHQENKKKTKIWTVSELKKKALQPCFNVKEVGYFLLYYYANLVSCVIFTNSHLFLHKISSFNSCSFHHTNGKNQIKKGQDLTKPRPKSLCWIFQVHISASQTITNC